MRDPHSALGWRIFLFVRSCVRRADKHRDSFGAMPVSKRVLFDSKAYQNAEDAEVTPMTGLLGCMSQIAFLSEYAAEVS